MHSDSQSVFCLSENLHSVVVLHDLRLGCLVVVDGLALILIGQGISLSNIGLKILDLSMSVENSLIKHS